MNILNAFTRRSLAENRTRTLVTVIGIVLSMAMFTAVIEGAYSGQQFLLRSEVARNGSYMLYYNNVTEAQAAELLADGDVKAHTAWRRVGWAEIGSTNEDKPYLLIKSIDANFTGLVALHLTSGRLPQNAAEILLPNHLASNGGVNYNLGDALTLSVGQRTVDGEVTVDELYPFDHSRVEAIADTTKKTYSVVGFYERLNSDLEHYRCPGYTALTMGDDGARGEFLELKSSSLVAGFEQRHPSDDHSRHSDLMYMSGVFGSGYLANMLYGFAGILVFIVAFGSISLIYNSFSISVSERTRQFGILKSVGATKKQIRRSVLYEALVVGGVGIPIGMFVGCVGIGVTLYLLRPAFTLLSPGDEGIQIGLVLHPAALLISAAVCLLTALISAWIPAKRAMRVSAIDAIRQTGDVKIKAKKVKTSSLTERLFRFEGMMASKNFKRNRKRYRSTVVSLFLSVTLFISASSFCAYLTDAVSGVSSSYDTGEDISYYTAGDDRPDPDELMPALSGVKGITNGTYYDGKWAEITVPAGSIHKSARINGVELDEGGETATLGLNIQFIDNASFDQLCVENGLDPKRYYDEENLRFLVYNHCTRQNYQGDSVRWDTFQFFDQNAFPISAMGATPPDELKAVTIDAELAEPPFAMSTNWLKLYAPYSMRGSFASLNPLHETRYAFAANNHAEAYKTMQQLLKEEGLDTSQLYDKAANRETSRMMVLVVNVFAYGFIILISLIAAANVFNTISTSISLRRREFAMLKSIGLGEKGFMRMMNYECLIYGTKGLLLGLPASAATTYLIWRVTNSGVSMVFYIPWYSVAIAVGSVFAVVFATMLYAAGRIRKDNPIDALKNENL